VALESVSRAVIWFAALCVRVSSVSPASVKSPSPLRSSFARPQLPTWSSSHCSVVVVGGGGGGQGGAK